MINVENIEVFNFEGAIRGMRSPMNSWKKSDSGHCAILESCSWDKTERSKQKCGDCYKGFLLGEDDLDLMRRLYKAGTEHRKYLRQIFVSMDIVAPLYWWKEFDTYKVGTTANSCSTMHKIQAKEFDIGDFSYEHLTDDGIDLLVDIISFLNDARMYYNTWDTQNDIDKEHFNRKDLWWNMIQMLPTSYNQRRTVTMNYENVISMIHQRTGHKLDEWTRFVETLKNLPYVKEIMGDDE